MGRPLVTEEAGQEEADLGDEGDKEERHEHRDKQGKERTDDASDAGTGDPATDEQHAANRWCAKPDTQVQHHDDPEVNRVDTQLHHDRQKDRSKNKNGRCHVHEGPDHKKYKIDDQQDDDLAVRHRHKGGADRLRDVLVGHDPGHPHRCTDKEHDNGCCG